jgi:hypothetical protein
MQSRFSRDSANLKHYLALKQTSWLGRIRAIGVLCLLLIVSCGQSSSLSDAITRHFNSTNGRAVSLSAAVPSEWERVCILGPYSNNATTKLTLGFEWDAKKKTSIQTNDGISLLLFVEGTSVVRYTEHSRANGDFSNLAGRCFKREVADFVHIAKPKSGGPGLFPKNA